VWSPHFFWSLDWTDWKVSASHQGLEQLDEFDEELFNEMVEKIAVDIDHVLRFRLRGGFDVAEPLWRETR
jgi:hypothetical protein